MQVGPDRKIWEVAQPVPDEIVARVRRIAGLEDVPEVVVQLLHNRGVTTPDDVRDFLANDPPPSADPFLLKDMSQAVERVTAAIDQGDLIAVYGDFDVDGVTSLALLCEVLSLLRARVVTYIPNRIEEGYGLHCEAIRGLHEQGVKLLITVDCGIGAGSEIAFAKSLGMDVVVTDHHQVSGPVPRACAVINPRQPGCLYPFKELAGVGVALKLAQALLQRHRHTLGAEPTDVEERLMDLVALGTIADVVPLLGENRALVRRGLVALNKTWRPGLQELVLRAGLKMGDISPTAVGYALAPRLNAAGRLAHADQSYKLLTTLSLQEARELAEYLDTKNAERQKLTSEVLVRARGEIARMAEDAELFVVVGADYPSGIVGLVAGRLAEERYRPVVVVELGAEESRGSARSVAGVDITKALADCSDLLTRFGGHAQAAGFTIPTEYLAEFKERLQRSVQGQLAQSDLQPRMHIDAELHPSRLTLGLFHAVNRLEPFGAGNPVPVFSSGPVRVVESRRVGRELPGHLRLRLHDGCRYWTAVGFNMGDEAELLTPGVAIEVAYSLALSEWNGTKSLDLHIQAWRPFQSSL